MVAKDAPHFWSCLVRSPPLIPYFWDANVRVSNDLEATAASEVQCCTARPKFSVTVVASPPAMRE